MPNGLNPIEICPEIKSMGECYALGNAHALISAHFRISLAGRPYRSCHRRRSSGRNSTVLDVYADFLENTLAIPVIPGEKTPSERFPGAVNTYTVEAMMQDCKALQAGTSHFLGQNFAKSFNIQFTDKHEQFSMPGPLPGEPRHA